MVWRTVVVSEAALEKREWCLQRATGVVTMPNVGTTLESEAHVPALLVLEAAEKDGEPWGLMF